MINLMNCEWVMTTIPKKGICCIDTQANVKFLALRLQRYGNREYAETFTYKKVNNPQIMFSTLPVTDYEITEHSCYIKFEGNIGIVELLALE